MQLREVLAHDAVRGRRASPDFRVDVRAILGAPHGQVDVVAKGKENRGVFPATRGLERRPANNARRASFGFSRQAAR